MTATTDLASRYRAHLGRGRGRLAAMLGGLVEDSAQGCTVRTTSGRELLNCGGYGVFFVGASHPVVVAAVERQVRRLPLSTRVLVEPAAADAAEALASVTPPGLTRMYFAGSGTEAVECAAKLACAAGRHRFVAMTNGYHGKTLGSLAFTANDLYRSPFRPLLHDVRDVPFGDLAALDAAVGAVGSDACVVVEPVQSEAGVVIPPPGYLAALGRLCRERDVLLVADEVMTGLGRTGSWWAGDAEQLRPDILLVGKSLSGGVVPVSATVATERAFAPFDDDPYLHTSTFSGAPLAMAAVAATIEVIRDEGLVARAAEVGRTVVTAFRDTAEHLGAGLVRQVRGAGLLIGVEFVNAGQAGEFFLQLLDHGVVANHSLNQQEVIRFTPPAIITDAEVERLAHAFEASCRATRGL